jgi:Flp pilus assembly pilin Flp
MTEYVIVVALVAIAAIAIVQVYGQQLRSSFYAMSTALAGKSATTEDKTSRAAVEKNEKSLANFGVNTSGTK